MPLAATKYPKVSAPRNLVRYKGRLTNVSDNGSYGFVRLHTITQVSGPSVGSLLFEEDLMAHVRENPLLGDPLPNEVWITFSLEPDERRKTGVRIYDAERT